MYHLAQWLSYSYQPTHHGTLAQNCINIGTSSAKLDQHSNSLRQRPVFAGTQLHTFMSSLINHENTTFMFVYYSVVIL